MKKSSAKISTSSSKQVNHVKPVSMLKSHFMMLWNDDNIEDMNQAAIANSFNLDKWKKKIGKNKEFFNIEINKNFLLEDEYWREGVLSI